MKIFNIAYKISYMIYKISYMLYKISYLYKISHNVSDILYFIYKISDIIYIRYLFCIIKSKMACRICLDLMKSSSSQTSTKGEERINSRTTYSYQSKEFISLPISKVLFFLHILSPPPFLHFIFYLYI